MFKRVGFRSLRGFGCGLRVTPGGWPSWAVRGLLAVSFAALPGFAQQQAQPRQFTLKEAVNRALSGSREVELARLQYEMSRSDAGVSRAQFRPNFYSGSGAAYTTGFPLLAGGGAPALFTLTYDQALFNLPARGEVRVAEQTAEQQRLAMENVRNGVIVRTVSAYLELAKARRELDLMMRERDSAQKIVDYTQQRLSAGYELPIELTRAQLTAARVEQRISRLEDDEETDSDQLRALLGLDADQPIQVAAEDIPEAADETVNDLVAQALQNNIEIKQAESQQASSEARLQGERGGYWPTISIIGQDNVLAKFNNYDQFFNKFQRNNVIAGVQVQIPIFASRTKAAISFARVNLTASQMNVENKRQQVSLDVRHKARQAREMDQGREVARLELDLSQQNLQVLQSQFEQGHASVRDLEGAQLDENDKWLAFLDADFARQQAQLDLLQTTGQVAKLLQ